MNPTEPDVGKRLGAYELRSLVDRGPLGARWRARVVSGAEAGRTVILRRISRDGLDTATVDRLSNAGFSAMEVRHPKVAAVLDVVVQDDEIAVVSEDVDGVLLRELMLREGKPTAVAVSAALRIVRDALDGLVEASSAWAGIYPEDEEDPVLAGAIAGGLCPDALVVAAFGEGMLADVGIAGVLSSVPVFADEPELLAYFAPERLTGAPPTAASQIFALGIILWELIAGRRLFAVEAPAQGAPAAAVARRAMQLSTVRRKVEKGPIPRLDKLPLPKGPASREVADFVARALERDPAKRYPSFEAMRDACDQLGAVVGDEQVLASVVRGVRGATGAETPAGRDLVTQSLDTVPPVSNRPTVPPARGDSAPPTSDRVTSLPDEAEASAFGVAARERGPASGDTLAPEARAEAEPESVEVEPVSEPPAPAHFPAPERSEPPVAEADVPPPPGFVLDSLPPEPLGEPASEESAEARAIFGTGASAQQTGPSETETTAAVGEPERSSASSQVTFGLEVGESQPPGGDREQRQARNRKMVFGVVSAAAVVAIVGLLTTLFGGEDEAASEGIAGGGKPPASEPVEPAEPQATGETAREEQQPADDAPSAANEPSVPAGEQGEPEVAPSEPDAAAAGAEGPAEPGAEAEEQAPGSVSAPTHREQRPKAPEKKRFRPTEI